MHACKKLCFTVISVQKNGRGKWEIIRTRKKKEGLLSRISHENIMLEMAGHWKQGWEYSFLASKATTMHFHKSK